MEREVVRAQFAVAEKQKFVVDEFAGRVELLVTDYGRRPKLIDQRAVFFKTLDHLLASKGYFNFCGWPTCQQSCETPPVIII